MSCPATIVNKSVADFCDWQGVATSHSRAMGNGTDLSAFRSLRGNGILPRLFHQSRLEGAPTRRYALSQCHDAAELFTMVAGQDTSWTSYWSVQGTKKSRRLSNPDETNGH